MRGRNVERQALTRYINRHSDLFAGHIVKNGKEIELDEKAIEILNDVYPLIKPVEVVDGIPQDAHIKVLNELNAVRKEKEALLSKLIEAQSQIAIANATQLLLEDKSKQLDEVKADRDELQNKLSNAEAEIEQYRNASLFQRLFGLKK